MSEVTYTKLGDLIGKEFTVNKVWGYSFKKWDDANKKMLIFDQYEEGSRKVWGVDTDKGKLDLGKYQLGDMLTNVMKDGIADLNGKTFSVKSNGKTGMEVRYYLNHVKTPQKESLTGASEQPLDEMPF